LRRLIKTNANNNISVFALDILKITGYQEIMRERKNINVHFELDVYQRAFAGAMSIFELSKAFPSAEQYSLTDQVRRSSRSVCVNIAEAWRKRRYSAHWISKLSDCEAEAAETQTWIIFAEKCGYLEPKAATELYNEYNAIIAMLVKMIRNPENWSLK
jgi:four helix bundle protein